MTASTARFLERLYKQDENPLASGLALERTLLINSGSWCDVGKAAISVHDIILQRQTVNRIIPVNRGILYWQAYTKCGIFNALVLYVQLAPAALYAQLKNWLGFRPRRSNNILPSVFQPKSPISWDNVSASKLDRPRIVSDKGVPTLVESTIRAVVFEFKRLELLIVGPARHAAKEQLAELQQEKTSSTKLIGTLLGLEWAFKDDQELQEVLSANVASMAAAVDVDGSNDLTLRTSKTVPTTPEESLALLQYALDLGNSSAVSSDLIPPSTLRYWPILTACAIAVYVVLGNREAVVAWFKDSVYVTARGFVRDWLLEPLYQIYKTIRHDPNARVALVGQQSLESDLDSLERMVIEYAKDSNVSATELEIIKEQVRLGNMSSVMQAYEQQIASPLSSLMTGKLVRTLLIQVQKTKVDAETALSGIDQLLQSQQLVFGVVAALPAFGAVIWLFGMLRSKPDILSLLNRRQELETSNHETLSNIENIARVSCDSQSRQYLLLEDAALGEIYSEIQVLQSACYQLYPKHKARLFSSELERLVGERDPQRILDDCLRLFVKY